MDLDQREVLLEISAQSLYFKIDWFLPLDGPCIKFTDELESCCDSLVVTDPQRINNTNNALIEVTVIYLSSYLSIFLYSTLSSKQIHKELITLIMLLLRY